MARVVRLGDAKGLSLPGRSSIEIVSGETGARAVTLRRVEIPVSPRGQNAREPHVHESFEECIYLLSGRGTSTVDGIDHPLEAGDTVLINPGEHHMMSNTGDEPLVLLCFFPVADIVSGTHEPAPRVADRNGESDDP